MRNLILGVMLLSMTASLNAQIVIGDFEGPDLDQGWAIINSGSGQFGTAWSSSGDQSLQFTYGVNGFQYVLRYNNLDNCMLLAESHVLQFELYRVTAEWMPTGENDFVCMGQYALNGNSPNQSPTFAQTTNVIDEQNSEFPSCWSPNLKVWGESNERTLTVDFRDLNYDFTDSTFGQLQMSVNSGSDYPLSGIGYFYIDNVRIVEPSDVLKGDVNQDGNIDLLDVSPFVALVSGGGFQAEADANCDGIVDLLDVNPFVELLTGG